ncbi:MAG: membrane protein insertion efficiency factor YidD [bacterium]|nr:membrane protein insertion efficiency factor YidD [bacterium]
MAKLFIFFIRLYQIFISPIKLHCCRFSPTCSQYAIDALQKYGLICGIYRTVRRLLRCHPFHAGGYDPA